MSDNFLIIEDNEALSLQYEKRVTELVNEMNFNNKKIKI